VMDEETFARGHQTPEEGGPKGLDLHPRTNVLAVTAECLPLAFFDLDAALKQDVPTESEDALLEYELELLAETRETRQSGLAQIELLREEAEAKECVIQQLAHQNAELGSDRERLVREASKLRDSYERSQSWRVTRPLRALSATLRHLR
jgi:hypothetical protein